MGYINLPRKPEPTTEQLLAQVDRVRRRSLEFQRGGQIDLFDQEPEESKDDE